MKDAAFRGVILCGGSGSRLWPLSRQLMPKQFIRLIDERSLLQHTLLRLGAICQGPPVLVCNEAHRFIVTEQADEIGLDRVEMIIEPCQRNTAPAIVAAALWAVREGEDPVILVMPSDHVLEACEALWRAFAQAYEAAQDGAMVTFGVTPTAPLTGYGYIEAQRSNQEEGAFPVQRFVEKPSERVARQFLKTGRYYWNSGMFAFRASVLLEEIEANAPCILEHVRAAVEAGSGAQGQYMLSHDSFAECPDLSLDYAVMEHTRRAVVIPLNVCWSDVGAWDAVWGVAEKSEDGNSTTGDVLIKDSRNCLIHASARLVASIGLENIVVVETADAVLVAHKDRAQDVKALVKTFQSQHRCELEHHREVHRPWGSYDCIGSGPRYQIKRITVKPGAKLSSQMHHHRAEHWVVVSGTARIYCGDKQYLLTENQSTYIPLGEVHSLENPGKIPLEIIEVQSGAYLGEDDIVRFDDMYGRAG